MFFAAQLAVLTFSRANIHYLAAKGMVRLVAPGKRPAGAKAHDSFNCFRHD